MTPRPSANDKPDRGLANSELAGEGLLGDSGATAVVAPPNGPHLRFCQPRIPCRRAAVRPVPIAVGHVARGRVPSQIAEAIIRATPVVVASMTTSGTWPDKGQQHQTVNEISPLDSAVMNAHGQIATSRVMRRRMKLSPSSPWPASLVPIGSPGGPARPDITSIRDGIAGKTGAMADIAGGHGRQSHAAGYIKG